MKEYKLSEILTIKNGRDYKNLKNGLYPVYGSGGLMCTVDNYLYERPSVLLPRKGTLSNIQFADSPFWTVDTLYYTEIDTHLADPYYLYYYLKQLDLTRLDSGTGVPSMTFDSYYNIKVCLPNIDKQRAVGQLLSVVDDKIQLNKRINDNLEAMAKQLYDYWFVQFDFPNEEGKPYKSSGGAMVWNEKLKREIPKAWYADNICKIANILSGGTPSKAVGDYWNNGTIPFFGPTDYNGNVFQIKTADHITQKGLEHCASSLFEEGIVIITARGSIGKLVIVGTPMAMNQSCYALQSKEGEFEYLYFLTTQLIDCLKAKGSGSVFKSIIASDIEHSILCVATENIVSDFCKKVKPLFEKLKTNTIEIAELTKQRDELLPLLMNGQASVNSD
jgi:type I restriction enzyme S subunit